MTYALQNGYHSKEPFFSYVEGRKERRMELIRE